MEFDSSDSGGVNLERFFFSVREALVVESLANALVAENCLCWLLLAIGSLPNDFFAEVWQNDERLPINGAREPDIEYDDAGKTEDDTVTEQRDYDDQNNADMSEEDGSYDGNEDSENNDDSGDSNGERGSSDGDEGDDDDENNEYSEDEYDEEDGEEYEEDEEDEEDEEGEDIPYRHSKKHKSVDGYSDDTTGSEYDDDTDDDPGFGSLLRHAREVYEVTSFRLFEREYKKKHALDLDFISDERLVFEYSSRKSGQHFREYKVTAEPLDDLINCSCKYFDLVGILCCHALMVLGCLRIEKIPEPYILKWRRKNGTGGTGEETLSLTDNYKGHGSSSDFIHHRRLMDTGIFHLVRSKDDLDMLNVGDRLLRRPRDMPVDRRLLRRGFFSYMRNGTLSQEENKRLEHLSIDPVHMEFDSEENEHMHSRYHVHAPLLRHARDVYLPNIYPMFREEHRKSEYLDVYSKNDTYDVRRGLVFDFEVLEPGYHKWYKVHAEPDDGSVYCSCKRFEKKGILCRHALSVMDRLFIEKVPAKYILGKFMKNQGVSVAEEIHGEKYSEVRHFIRWKTLRTKLDKLAQIAATSDAASAIFVEDMEKIQVMLGHSSDEKDKAMKKATGKNRGQNRMQSNAEELETKRVNQSAHLSMEAIDQNKNG